MTRDRLAGSEPLTGLICTHERLAVGALLAATELGLEIPGDLSIVSLEDGEQPRRRAGPRHGDGAATGPGDGGAGDRPAAQELTSGGRAEPQQLTFVCPVDLRASVGPVPAGSVRAGRSRASPGSASTTPATVLVGIGPGRRRSPRRRRPRPGCRRPGSGAGPAPLALDRATTVVGSSPASRRVDRPTGDDLERRLGAAVARSPSSSRLAGAARPARRPAASPVGRRGRRARGGRSARRPSRRRRSAPRCGRAPTPSPRAASGRRRSSAAARRTRARRPAPRRRSALNRSPSPRADQVAEQIAHPGQLVGRRRPSATARAAAPTGRRRGPGSGTPRCWPRPPRRRPGRRR